MAGFGRSRQSDPSGLPNAIVGAARRVHLDRKDEVASLRERSVDQRQQMAWKYYDRISEIKSAYNYYASVASRVRLFAGFVASSADSPVPIGAPGDIDRDLVTAARYELDKLGTGPGGMPGLIRAIVLNLLVPGEGYLVGANGSWSIRSTSELKFEADGRVKLVTSRHNPNHGSYLPADAFIARIWRTHPEFSEDADSALYGLFDDCSDLLLTSRLIRASVRSKLSAGLIYMPDELRFQRSADPAGDNVDPDLDPFEEEFTLALTDPVGDTDSPAELVPLIIRGPAEFAEAIKLIELGRQFDPQLIERYKQLLERVLNGLEIPADLITSLHNVRYSNAQALMEDFLKAYIEPMIVWVCEALTTVFLRPKLIARGFTKDDVQRVSVWYDPSEVVTRPDRSDAADNGYERMLVSGRTWREVHGFSELDAPKAEEIVQRIGVTGQIPPENMIDVLRAMAPELIGRIEALSGKPFEVPELPGAGAPETINPGSAPGPKPVSPASPAPPAPSTGITIETNPRQSPEGPLPPREHAALDTLQVDSYRTDRVLEALAALSVPSGPSATVRERERQLRHAMEADRRLRDSLSTMLDALVADAIERVGSDVITASVSDPGLDAMLADADLSEAFALLPADRRAEFGLEDYEQTLTQAIARGRKAFVTAVTRAQNQGWKALGAEVYETARASQAEHVDRAWEWLSGQLVRIARRRVHRPETANAYVSLDLVRAAQAIAGGSTAESRRDTGRAVLSTLALRATGWELGTRYRWVYGISENRFEPHASLDDVTFDSWESHALAAADPDSWPYVSYYRPGDHSGCSCDWLPEVLEPDPAGAPAPEIQEART